MRLIQRTGSIAVSIVMLTACGQSTQNNNADDFKASVSSTTAATPAEVAASSATSAEDLHANEPVPVGGIVVEQVTVSIANSGPGIAATIHRLDPMGRAVAIFAKTNQEGRAAVNKTCTGDDQFQVEPNAGSYLKKDPLLCAVTLAFQVYSAAATFDLIKSGDNAFSQGLFTEAQKQYGIAAEQLRVSMPDQSQMVTLKFQQAVGRALGTTELSNPGEGASTLSPDAIQRLRTFQRESNLPETGVVDSRTSEALGKISVQEAQRRATRSMAVTGANVATPHTEVNPDVAPAAAVAQPAPTVGMSAAVAAGQHYVAPSQGGAANPGAAQ